MHFTFQEKVISNHIAVLGKTGSGKTSTAKLLIEQVVAAGFRVCVLDTVKSDWWGITSSAMGKSAGLPFKILGGPRGHVPLHSSAGNVIGQLVGSGKLPLSIVDMADFEPGGIQKFFVDFSQSLMRNIRGVVYLVIEEAHEVAPKERAGFHAENMAIHYAKKLATAGRSKGIRLVVATQRVQSLHNAVLGSCETVIAQRLTMPADQEPVVKWLKANADKETCVKVSESLSSLPNGTGWLCSGEAKLFSMVTFPKFSTYDNTATPAGDEAEREIKTAQVDTDQLKTIIGDALQEAMANDPKELRKTIAKLQTEIRQIHAPVATQRVEVPVLQGGELDTLKKILIEFQELALEIMQQVQQTKPQLPVRPAPKPIVHTPVVPIEGLTRKQQDILNAVAWWESIGVKEPSVLQVGVIALVDPSGGYFSNTVGPLSTAGYIDRGNGALRLTEAGRRIAVIPENIGTLAEYHNMLRERVRRCKSANGKTVDILNCVIDSGGEVTVADIGQSVGIDPSGGYFSNSIGPLGTLGLIERNNGVVRATTLLFPPL